MAKLWNTYLPFSAHMPFKFSGGGRHTWKCSLCYFYKMLLINYTHINTIALVCVRACACMLVCMNSTDAMNYLCRKIIFCTEMPIIVAYQQTAALNSVIYRAGRDMSYCKCVLLIIKRQGIHFCFTLKVGNKIWKQKQIVFWM
jgi:hypothetical protein